MNILPKKRWHVRTKDNIARVRRDEAAAREEENERKRKLELAESEARINFLRKKSDISETITKEDFGSVSSEAKVTESQDSSTSKHIDLFSDFKTHIKTTNKDLEKEKKEEREKYEKQIGYLTYLGQDTNEALKLRSWYEVAPQRSDSIVGEREVVEKDIQKKHRHDPLTLINALLPAEKNTESISIKFRKSEQKNYLDNKSEKVSQYLSEAEDDDNEKHRKYSSSRKLKKSKKCKHKKKSKKHSQKHDIETDRRDKQKEKLHQLRKERLLREAKERERADLLLLPKDEHIQPIKDSTGDTTSRIIQKYNSQFNPNIAKQNML